MKETAIQDRVSRAGAQAAQIATMRERDDASLLQAIAADRDEAAFAELFRRYEKTAICLAFQITGSLGMAEEAVQDAFLRVWTRAGTYRLEVGEPRPWLLRITAREALKMLRRQRKDMKAKDLESDRGAAFAEPPGAVVLGEHEELLAALRRSVSELPDTTRQIVALYFGAGLTQAEIGKELDLSQRAVSNRLSGTVERLRTNLARAGFAAAAPLLGAEQLGEALCTGFPAPPHLAAQMLLRLKDAGADAARTLTRRAAAAPGSHARLFVAVVLASAAGAGTWYWHETAPTPAARPASSQASAETKTPVLEAAPVAATPERTEWHWNFEDSAFEDELPRTEGWEYVRSSVSKHMVLASPAKEPLKYFLKLPVSCDRTLVVDVHASPGVQGRQLLLFVFVDGDRMLPFDLHDISELYQLTAPALIHWRFYVRGCYIVQCDQRRLSEPAQLLRSSVPMDHHQLALCCANWLLTEISVRVLPEAEVPAPFRDPAKLIHAERQPQVIGGATLVFSKKQEP